MKILVSFLVALPLFALEPVASGARVYIHPLNGFGTYLSAAFRIKGVPLTVVAYRAIADYEVIGNSDSQKAGWAKVLILKQTGSREEASISVIDVRTSEVVFAYNYNTGNSYRGKQSAAESCAKHLRHHVMAGGRLVSSLPPFPPQPIVARQSEVHLEPASHRETRRMTDAPAQPAYPISVRFTSAPAAAELIVDGEFWGVTPTADLTMLSEGSHAIVLKKFGYERWERTVRLSAGEPRTIHAELQPEVVNPVKARIVGLD